MNHPRQEGKIAAGMELPEVSNGFQADHAALLLRSYHERTGHHLLDPTPTDRTEAARALFEAPFFVASHNTDRDPVLTYGNRKALDLFGMSWENFTSTPSRFTAEAPQREERAHLLNTVATQGYIDNYSGIRISSTGQRFRIDAATVWNLTNEHGALVGQAATFSHWEPV